MSAPAPAHRTRLQALALAAVALAGTYVALTLLARENPLRRAADAATAAGAYTFDGASGSTYGTLARQYTQSGSGHAFGPITVTLGTTGTEPILIAWPAAQRPDGTPVTPRSLAPALSAGDPLGLVAAGHAARKTRMDQVAGHDCERFEFLTAGRAYVAWWAAHPRAVPVNADAGGLPTFTARGVLWADPATGLPCRIWAELDLPRIAGDQAGTGWVDWTYSWTSLSGAAE